MCPSAYRSHTRYTRIHGELGKLGVKLSRRSVANILGEAGVPNGPARGEGTWNEFLKTHAQTLWACDFVSKKVLTWRGWRDAYLLVFIHIKSRRVHISPASLSPSRPWVTQQAVRFVAHARRGGLKPEILIHDRDSKFGPEFDSALERLGVDQTKLPHRSPNLNAHVERFIKTLEVECMDRFIVMGARHMDHLVKEFTDYYNRQRPHSGIGGETPMGMSRAGSAPPGQVQAAHAAGGKVCCRKRLGGVLKHYYRSAA